MTFEIVLVCLVAYLVGSIPVAYLVGRASRGVDLRKFGSGNVGASNLIKAKASKRWVVPVGLWDLGKGMAMIALARGLDFSTAAQFAVGLSTIAGHNWPLFLHFHGGRGILTSLGVILMFSPLLGLVVVVIAFSPAAFKMLSFGVFTGLLCLPFLAYFLSDFFSIVNPRSTVAGFALLTAVAYTKRLIGRKSSLATGLSWTEVLSNRLFLDRDIRNRKAWINRSEGHSSGIV